MAFPNAKKILKTGSLLSRFKLLLAAASSSRPGLHGLCLLLLRPFARNGDVSLTYRCYRDRRRSTLRISDLSADYCSTLELCIKDIYHLDPHFQPDVVIDGGGNIGIFTLCASACYSLSAAKFIVCEPLPKNIDRIRKHLSMNAIEAEIVPYCIGGTRRLIPFYCRAANESSFDPRVAYDSVIEIPVVLIEDTVPQQAERILIKLDIEGMEVEALSAYLPQEHRAVYIVGELHDFAANAPRMRQLFDGHGWTLDLFDIGNETSSFRACSPSALPFVPSLQNIKSPARAIA